MANPTTNYGWVMPTSTDLVTDLPADFAVFGQAVDTSMADLKGGTTGQILAKATNTDMDFTWITNDQGDITAVNTTAPLAGGGTSGALTLSIASATTSVAGAVQLSDSTSTTSSVLAATPTAVKSAYDLADGAIAKTTVTTAGDILYRNATVPVRLGIGTAGQVLQVNSGATAPEWATPAGGGGMTLINTSSMSAVSSLSMNNIFSSTYSRYRILIYTTQSVADWINLRLRVSGTDNTTSNYFGSNIRRTGGANTGTDAVATTGWSKFMFAGQKLSTISFDIMNPFSSSLNTVTTSTFGAQETSNAEVVTGTSYGLFNADTSFDGLSLISTGTMTGQVKVYGYPE
jgi:hypothetical protein